MSGEWLCQALWSSTSWLWCPPSTWIRCQPRVRASSRAPSFLLSCAGERDETLLLAFHRISLPLIGLCAAHRTRTHADAHIGALKIVTIVTAYQTTRRRRRAKRGGERTAARCQRSVGPLLCGRTQSWSENMSCNDARIQNPPCPTSQPPPPHLHVSAYTVCAAHPLSLSSTHMHEFFYMSVRQHTQTHTHTHTQAHARTHASIQTGAGGNSAGCEHPSVCSLLFTQNEIQPEANGGRLELINQSDDFRHSDTIGIDCCLHS